MENKLREMAPRLGKRNATEPISFGLARGNSCEYFIIDRL